MAQTTSKGTAQPVSAQQFNERIKRLLGEKSDPFEGVTSRPARARPARFERKKP